MKDKIIEKMKKFNKLEIEELLDFAGYIEHKRLQNIKDEKILVQEILDQKQTDFSKLRNAILELPTIAGTDRIIRLNGAKRIAYLLDVDFSIGVDIFNHMCDSGFLYPEQSDNQSILKRMN
ncbi:MAG: hypothetical protein WAO52_07195 [Prolixibacteraceae bacterium]